MFIFYTKNTICVYMALSKMVSCEMSYFSQLHNWELPLVEAVQSIRTEASDKCFLFLNMFDTFLPYLLILVTTWHLKDKKKGFHLAILQSLGVFLYASIKYLVAEPRPYEIMPSLKILATSGYGFPSGAALSSMIALGFISFFLHPTKLLVKVLCILLIIFIGIARIYLGAHFPSDVVGGWLIGLAILLLYGVLIAYIEQGTNPLSNRLFFLTGLTAVITMLCINVSMDIIIITSFFIGTVIGYIFLKPCSQKYSIISSIIAVAGISILYKLLLLTKTSPLSHLEKIAIIIMISFSMGFWLNLSERMARYFQKILLRVS